MKLTDRGRTVLLVVVSVGAFVFGLAVEPVYPWDRTPDNLPSVCTATSRL